MICSSCRSQQCLGQNDKRCLGTTANVLERFWSGAEKCRQTKSCKYRVQVTGLESFCTFVLSVTFGIYLMISATLTGGWSPTLTGAGLGAVRSLILCPIWKISIYEHMAIESSFIAFVTGSVLGGLLKIHSNLILT